MHRRVLLSAAALIALAACSKPAEKPAVDTTAAKPAPPPPAPKPHAFVTVIYNAPKSAAAFEKLAQAAKG